MKVKPLGDRVLVRRLEAEEKTKGGIVLPDTAKEKPKQGEIMEVGDGKVNDQGKKIELSVKKGDKVLFSSYAGTDVKIDGEEYLILKEEDVLAIIKEK
jgi:chaperonin GroES